jgi:hypothetical protein
VGQQKEWRYNQTDVKNETDKRGDGILLGGLIEGNNPVKYREPEPFPAKITVNGFVLFRTYLEKQDKPHNHPAKKHPERQPQQWPSEQFIEAHRILLFLG